MSLIIIASVTVLSLVSIILYMKWKFAYWERKGLNYIQPELFFGNIREEVTQGLSFGEQYQKFYNYFKSKGLKHGGIYMFTIPIYIPIDQELIKNILLKDFGHFMSHGLLHVDEEIDPMSTNLFNLENDKWKNLRTKLTPAFTSSKIKTMFDNFQTTSENLIKAVQIESESKQDVYIKDIVSRYATDVIGSSVFGVDCNSLKNSDSLFHTYGKRLFEPKGLEKVKNLLFYILPEWTLKLIRLKQFSKEIEDFYFSIVEKTISHRETSNVYRKDFIQLLMEVKNDINIGESNENGTREDSNNAACLTLTEMAAQCFVFFLAGFETSSTTMTFALLEMVLNENVQNTLREEINKVLEKYDGRISYDTVMEMKYLDKVVQETLRKHPPLGVLPRKCTKAYPVPGTSVIIEAGTRVFIPIEGIQKDPHIYPEPEKFDPERFSTQNKTKRSQFSFLTFGEGPRICIGARFGLLQVKMGLISIVRHFRITLSEKTKLPIKYTSDRFISGVDGGVWLKFNKIRDTAAELTMAMVEK